MRSRLSPEQILHLLHERIAPDIADRLGQRQLLRTRLHAILSEAAARQSFGTEDPIGHQLQCGLDNVTMMPMTIAAQPMKIADE